MEQGEKVTPLMVRDAIVECFNKAHCEDAGFETEEKDLNERYCKSVVEKFFREAGGDFNKPTRESILKVVDGLVSFSKNFRNPELIKKHYDEIMVLVNKL